ncbi:GNAT family N-acetyltransferase [Lysinibacillus sp. JNUCC 51]|uniref:GNAT family N-acetyltransferase n=1 Tax=Lysinibacillus sp. JNUCC-51 TaxID=2792479 RepID=UPI001938CB80|nr:GNAT family N-acetyltransferase [Lysinibacillus sp. JNUCC-51]
MELRLEKAIENDAQAIFDIQVKAFMPLLNKYEDYETNPANETIERVISRINQQNGSFYKILADNTLVGAIFVHWREEVQFWISPMFILPTHQGKGIAQKVINLIEGMFPQATTWELATILEEERNCYLYEKMGYSKTGRSKKLNDNVTLIFYKKVC